MVQTLRRCILETLILELKFLTCFEQVWLEEKPEFVISMIIV